MAREVHQDRRPVKLGPASVSRDSLSETSSRSFVITTTASTYLVSLAFSQPLSRDASAPFSTTSLSVVVDENDRREINQRGWNNSKLAASDFACSLSLSLSSSSSSSERERERERESHLIDLYDPTRGLRCLRIRRNVSFPSIMLCLSTSNFDVYASLLNCNFRTRSDLYSCYTVSSFHNNFTQFLAKLLRTFSREHGVGHVLQW